MCAIGKNYQLYITDVGCIVRRFAPLQVKGWSKIPRNEVETLILRVREKFKLSTEPHVDVAIEEDMKRRYTRWRYTLHQMFIECQTMEQALANPPVEVDVDDWKYLVELWNKDNNSQIQFTHSSGTKAFSRVRWENRNPETGVLPSRIDTLKLTRYDEENKKLLDDDAKKAYDEMDRLRTNPPKELQHMSEDEIYDHVLGEAPSGYIRGLGAGPKPKPSSGVVTRRCAQVEASTRRAEEAEAQSAKLAEELTTVKNELAEMRSNFNQQLLDIQAQLRDNLKIFFFLFY
ncbi:hypothetical protein Dsin_020974 [Dipteronia sinensis]|uniref:Transposase n=1 Tax=Dipteronia sinensis TaxID=43782 RepID=A0AAE0ABF9_9ROSI|nr:hypothetical protein Dsin_020974 [Dipteronia sinensis]